MNKKENIDLYLKNLFELYKSTNYKNFVNKILNYNIPIGSYKKNIENISNKIFMSIINNNELKNVMCKEYLNYYFIKSKNMSSNNRNNIIMDIPVFEENFEIISKLLVEFCIKNNINFSVKIYKYVKNTILVFTLNNINDANKFIDFFSNDIEIKNITKSRTLPFLYQISFIGIYTQVNPYSFKTFYVQYLYKYLSKNNDIENISCENFMQYIEILFKSEKKLNKKRMLYLLYNYLFIIVNDNDIFDLFKSNLIMNLSSFQGNDYILKLDNEMIYFINKLDPNIEIRYGSEEFFNIAYSKYYENVIKQERSDKYYNLFYNVYDKILTNNYNYLDEILELTNSKMDRINKILIISSSLFYAQKKFNFSFKISCEIMNYLLPKLDNYNYKKDCDDLLFEKYDINEEYGNKIIKLKNGDDIKIRDYLYNNDVISSIPCNCNIELKDGSKMNGREYIENLYKFIPNYNNYRELVNDLIDNIEFYK